MAMTMERRKAPYDLLVKLLVIGDSGVGKSNLLLRFTDNAFTPSFITTIGIDFKIKTIVLENGFRIRLQIWDTAGQERYRTITNGYYRGSMGILLVYDISDEQSFLNVHTWMRNIESHASSNVNRILIGNKCDLENDRQVDTERGQRLADKYNVKFFETSAKDDININEPFEYIARQVVDRLVGGSTRRSADSTTSGSTVVVDDDETPDIGSRCC